MKDLTGKTFGRLTVLRKSLTQGKGTVSWYCVCECGNYIDTQSKYLLHGGTRSCGCLAKESARGLASKLAEKKKQIDQLELSEIRKKEIKTRKERHYVDGVDTTALTMNIRKDNKSGIKGVHYDKSRNKWKVTIAVNKQNINVGRFNSLEEAKKAREEAEKIYFEPIISKINSDKHKNATL